MNTLHKIAFFQKRRDEVPNQLLAKELARKEDAKGIAEIAAHLQGTNKNIQSDCLKVLYEIGYIKPKLIAQYADEFTKLLKSKNNRMVWGAMIALATIAFLKPEPVMKDIELFKDRIENGTVITRVWGITAIARAISKDKVANRVHFPFLLNQLEKCIPRDLPRHAADTLPAVQENNEEIFMKLIRARIPELSQSQLAKLKKSFKEANRAL